MNKQALTDFSGTTTIKVKREILILLTVGLGVLITGISLAQTPANATADTFVKRGDAQQSKGGSRGTLGRVVVQ